MLLMVQHPEAHGCSQMCCCANGKVPYDEGLRAVASAVEGNDIVRAAQLRERMVLRIGLQCHIS